MPNASVLEAKKAVVAELTEKLQNAASGVLVDYKGITVAEDTALRTELRANDVEYAVVKNTLTRFAAEGAGLGELSECLNGTTSLAICNDDPVAPARVINDFAKKCNGHFEIKGGFMDGKVISLDEVNALASIPALPVLQAQVLGTMLAPITSFAVVIKAIAEKEYSAYKEYIDAYNAQYGTNYTMIDAFCWIGTATDAIFINAGVDYYAFAIGVGADGELNGLWAKSDVIHVAEEDMTPEYAAWLGDWTFTGSNGASYNVTLEKKISNTSYNLYGWDGNDLDEYPVEVSWEADYGLWTIYPQNFGTFEFQDGSKGDIYFLGGQENEQGFSLYTDVPACMGFVAEDGSYNVLGFADEESGIDMTLMCHFVVIDGTPYFWNDPAAVPTFPITVTPAEATASTRSAKKEFKTSKHLSHKLPKVAMFTPEFKAL